MHDIEIMPGQPKSRNHIVDLVAFVLFSMNFCTKDIRSDREKLRKFFERLYERVDARLRPVPYDIEKMIDLAQCSTSELEKIAGNE